MSVQSIEAQGIESDSDNSDSDPTYVPPPESQSPATTDDYDCVSLLKASQSSSKCPYGRNCRPMGREDLIEHKKFHHFSCSSCREVYQQADLEKHIPDHKWWNLLPLDPIAARSMFEDGSQSEFRAQGYWLVRQYARELQPHDAQTMLQVREQVDNTWLMVNLEGTKKVNYAPLQHCYNVRKFVARIAYEFEKDPEDIELIHIMLPWDFDQLGEIHVIAANDHGAFTAFIGMIEKSWRKGEGLARTLMFSCKVFLRSH